MPTYFDQQKTPTVQFDHQLEISPFKLFRDLKDGKTPLLLDVRAERGTKTIRGAIRYSSEDWDLPADREVILIDNDGSEAVPKSQKLQNLGFGRVRALFGGLDLYEFSLDPQVVGEDTYLEIMESDLSAEDTGNLES